MVLSLFTPAFCRRSSRCSRLTISRLTGSTRSVCQLRFTAPGICPRSYTPGFTLTSRIRMSLFFRFFANHSVDTKKRSEEHTSELQSRPHLVCRLLLEKKKKQHKNITLSL